MLASQQFGPRLLRSLLRDLGSRIVLGTFVSIFVYCLLVLRTIRGNDDPQFVRRTVRVLTSESRDATPPALPDA